MGSVTKDQVIAALKDVYDPEMPVDIYNFGLVYDIAVSEEDAVKIQMTLTSESCPSARQIPDDAKKKVMQIPGATGCDIEVVWEPRWSAERITPEGREMLGLEDD